MEMLKIPEKNQAKMRYKIRLFLVLSLFIFYFYISKILEFFLFDFEKNLDNFFKKLSHTFSQPF